MLSVFAFFIHSRMRSGVSTRISPMGWIEDKYPASPFFSIEGRIPSKHTDNANITVLWLGRFAHLLCSITERHNTLCLKYLCYRKIEVYVVFVIKMVDNITRNFHVLCLIFSHRNVSGVIDHYIGCHQNRVGKKTEWIGKDVILTPILLCLGCLVFKLVHAKQTVDVDVIL